MSQQFCLKWNNHTTNMLQVFENLLTTEALVDVTLACDGLSLKAHKMVLSACSPFFQSLFLENPCKHPIVIMKDMRYCDLKAIIDFMYRGEVNVSHDQLSALLKTAETLKVKGLAEVTGENKQASGIVQHEIIQNNTSTPIPVPPSAQRTDTPPLQGKRKRGRPRKRSLSDSNRSDDEGVPPKIKETNSDIEELSGDASMEATSDNRSSGGPISCNSQSQVPIHSSNNIVNTFSKSHLSTSQDPQGEEPASGDENEFEVEPSKLLEQTLTTENVPSNSHNSTGPITLPSVSGLEISRRSMSSTDSGSQALVPVSIPSDSLGSNLQGPDSPQDVKPQILSFDDPPISPVAGTSHGSDRSLMMYMDQSGVASIPGPSNFQDNSALVPHDSQPQGISKHVPKPFSNVKTNSFSMTSENTNDISQLPNICGVYSLSNVTRNNLFSFENLTEFKIEIENDESLFETPPINSSKVEYSEKCKISIGKIGGINSIDSYSGASNENKDIKIKTENDKSLIETTVISPNKDKCLENHITSNVKVGYNNLKDSCSANNSENMDFQIKTKSNEGILKTALMNRYKDKCLDNHNILNVKVDDSNLKNSSSVNNKNKTYCVSNKKAFLHSNKSASKHVLKKCDSDLFPASSVDVEAKTVSRNDIISETSNKPEASNKLEILSSSCNIASSSENLLDLNNENHLNQSLENTELPSKNSPANCLLSVNTELSNSNSLRLNNVLQRNNQNVVGEGSSSENKVINIRKPGSVIDSNSYRFALPISSIPTYILAGGILPQTIVPYNYILSAPSGMSLPIPAISSNSLHNTGSTTNDTPKSEDNNSLLAHVAECASALLSGQSNNKSKSSSDKKTSTEKHKATVKKSKTEKNQKELKDKKEKKDKCALSAPFKPRDYSNRVFKRHLYASLENKEVNSVLTVSESDATAARAEFNVSDKKKKTSDCVFSASNKRTYSKRPPKRKLLALFPCTPEKK